ncbi:jg8324, partial [Pararge aegeria aegeria]
ISWISLILYLFYKSFIYYLNGRQFFYLRRILGLGLCVSRGTATVLNLCCALVLVPLCKKLNQLLYRVMSKLCPGLFFFWLERAKSFHMTVAITLVFFAVIHSVSHFVNLWNFSRSYDEERKEINMANYKNQ